VIIYFFYRNKSKNKKNTFVDDMTNINFISKEEAMHFILDDNDNYINNMSELDLIARGCKILNNLNDTKKYYKQISSNAMGEFTNEEKNMIIQTYNKIKNEYIFQNIKYKNISIQFAKIIGNQYDNSAPQTRNNIIFMPINAIQNELTMKHEIIHIYQRYNPIPTENILNSYGFYKVGNFKKLFPEQYKMRRSNPDIDDNIWKDKYENLMFPIFSNNNPNSLSDIESSHAEHPYEWMAYTFSKNV